MGLSCPVRAGKRGVPIIEPMVIDMNEAQVRTLEQVGQVASGPRAPVLQLLCDPIQSAACDARLVMLLRAVHHPLHQVAMATEVTEVADSIHAGFPEGHCEPVPNPNPPCS